MSQFVETRVGDFLGRTDRISTSEPRSPAREPEVKLSVADQIFTF
jgi:hypothetical protein